MKSNFQIQRELLQCKLLLRRCNVSLPLALANGSYYEKNPGFSHILLLAIYF
jgi:hypothetical protein